MKKITRVLMLLTVVAFFAVSDSNAQQIVVRVRPNRPGPVVVRRPLRPSPRHVWVAEEWTPAGGTYVYHAGYWAIPPHPGAVWVAGSWSHGRKGYGWRPGRWN
jgi:hypothetical protein